MRLWLVLVQEEEQQQLVAVGLLQLVVQALQQQA
jgi:hypothetical protein